MRGSRGSLLNRTPAVCLRGDRKPEGGLPICFLPKAEPRTGPQLSSRASHGSNDSLLHMSLRPAQLSRLLEGKVLPAKYLPTWGQGENEALSTALRQLEKRGALGP